MDLQSVFVRHFIETFADRIRQFRHMTDIPDDPVNTGIIQQQPVTHGGCELICGIVVQFVGRQDRSAVRI